MNTPRAKIYQPAKTAMQSGKGKARQWVLEFERPAPATPDALMGWNTMASTVTQVKLFFAMQEEAIAYANAKNIPFTVSRPHHATVAPKAYAENFSSSRRQAFDGDC
jgi:ETC complex I subunit conserved region